VVVDVSTTVVAATTHLDSKEETERQTSASAVADICRKYGIALAAAAERSIPKRCRTYDPSSTDEEIAHFTEVKILQLRNNRNVGNIVGLLLTAVPEFFVEPAHELAHFREGKAREQAAAEAVELQAAQRTAALAEEEATRQRLDQAWAELPETERAQRLANCRTQVKQQYPRLSTQQQELFIEQLAKKTPLDNPQLAKTPQTTPPVQDQLTLRKLIADCYRELNAPEFAALKACFPDETILGEKVKSLKQQGGVDPKLSVDFLAAALKQFT
jgi:hypothetical protein